jgi:hypothetical protein
MRRILSSVFSMALLLAVSFSSNAQPTAGCTGFSTTAASGITYNLYQWYQIVPDAGAKFESDIFYSNSVQTKLDFYLRLHELQGGANASVTPTVTVKWGPGGINSYTCNPAVAATQELTSTPRAFYLSIEPNVPIPAGTNFQIVVTLAKSVNQRDVVISGYGVENSVLATLNAVLPVKFGAFTAKSSTSAVTLNWTIDAEENTKGYEVERSTDGRNFSAIGVVAATGSRSYSFTDANPVSSAHYRIKALDNDGKFGYSIVLRVKGTESLVDIKAFFSSRNSLVIQHEQATAGSMVSVTTADGKMLKKLAVTAGAQQTMVDVSAARSGLLLVRFESAKGQVETIKVVKP